MEGPESLAAETAPPEDLLIAFTGPERILGVLPFVADVSSTPRWHHLLFTEDKILAVPAFAEPAPEASSLFLPQPAAVADRHPAVREALGLVAIPRPLTPAHVTAVIPYAMVRRVRLTHGRASQSLPELEIRAGRRTSWWFFRKEDGSGDLEAACYARDLLLDLLPFPVELVGFSEAPRPAEWRLRRGVREPLPLLATTRPDGPRPARAVPSRENGP